MESISTKRIFALVAVFTGWMVTSFLCHECGKTFLELSKENVAFFFHVGGQMSRFLFASALTVIQCVTCYLCVSTRSSSDDSLATILIGMFHILATMATNYSMAYIEAASTLALKLTEPVTMAIAQRLFFKTTVTIETLISLPIIIFGALLFSVNAMEDKTETTGIVLAFASNIILTARNVAIKSMHVSRESSSSPVSLRRTWQISALLVSQLVIVLAAYVLERESLVPAKTSLTLGLLLTSGNFHVAYSYISTNVVLKVMSIVSHSVANIFKRLLVVLLLYLVGRRHATMWNFSGLALACLGLYIYVHGKRTTTTSCVTESNSGAKHVTLSIFASKTLHRAVGLLLAVVFIVFVSGQVYQKNVFSMLRDATMGGKNYDPNRELESFDPFAPDSVAVISDSKMSEFVSWHLVDHPEETDTRAKTLSRSVDIVAEAQRVLVNLLRDLIGAARYVMLMEIAVYENKGDPAISAGEVLLLRKMNKTVVFYCSSKTCWKESYVKRAVQIGKKYAPGELVILMQGGGNMVGYPSVDNMRDTIIHSFPDRKIIVLSQSIWLHSNSDDGLKNACRIYSNNSNLVLFLRDRQSLAIAKENFKGVTHILAPDMAFGIGMVPRQMPPLYDIVWLKRRDGESTRYALPDFPGGITINVSDWAFDWKANKGATDMETAFLLAQAGFQFLQRGRVVITDRLHGHILSTLMNIPHVVIDNPPYLKLSSFGRSWTASLSNVVRVDNGSLALTAALQLLKQFDSVLPQVGPNNVEHF